MLTPIVAPPRVLIVDDTPSNLLVLETVLDGLDCEVVSATSGAQALTLLENDQQFALLLLDVNMPVMDGYEVARRVRMDSSSRRVPIIFLTAGAADPEEGARLGYGSGAVDYIIKPLNRDMLRGKVRIFLELDISRRELARANRLLQRSNIEALALAEAEADASETLRQAYGDLRVAYEQLRGAGKRLSAPPPASLALGSSAVVAEVVTKLQQARGSLASIAERFSPSDPAAVVLCEAASTLESSFTALQRLLPDGDD